MAGRTRSDPRRLLALLSVGLFVTGGCGTASRPAAYTSTAGQPATASTSTGPQASGSGSSAAASGGPSGIAGQTVAIACGGPSSVRGCRRPVIATIEVLRMPSEQRIATVRTDNRGHFRRNLPPGTYELRAHTSNQLVWARVITARVLPHQIKRTTITFVPRHPLPIAPGSASG